MRFWTLLRANLGRHKRRTFLTIASVALALFLFASLRTVVTTLGARPTPPLPVRAEHLWASSMMTKSQCCCQIRSRTSSCFA